MSDLARLAKPFPARFIKANPSGGGSYVKHSVITEKLLAVVGPFDFELVQIIRGHVEGITPNPDGKSNRAKTGAPTLDDAIVGVVARLTVTVDGRYTHIEEAGDCEDPHNWPHDGARLKDAMSDALKRCAMRLGVTLHLYSQEQFTLHDQLVKRDEENAGMSVESGEHPARAVPAPSNGVAVPTGVDLTVDTPALPLGAK